MSRASEAVTPHAAAPVAVTEQRGAAATGQLGGYLQAGQEAAVLAGRLAGAAAVGEQYPVRLPQHAIVDGQASTLHGRSVVQRRHVVRNLNGVLHRHPGRLV